MRRAFVALLLVAAAAAVVASQSSPAQAAATGPLSVHVEGTLGDLSFDRPPLTVWPFRASETLRGLIDVANEFDGTIVAFEEGDPDRPLQVGSVYTTQLPPGAATFACVATQFGARGEPLGGSCAATGAVVGRGTFRISAFELAAGASLSWDVSFARAFCRDC